MDEGNTKYDSRDNCNAIIETETNTLIFGCKSTVIPDGVTSIGKSAFRICSGLTSVTIPNSVESIGYSAFSGCSGLTSVTIGNSVTSIGGMAFYVCSGLKSVTIPNSVTSIGQSAFSGCSGLTSVTIPNSVTSIENEVFYSCSGLKSVTIGNSVTSIGERAFSGCSGLTSVTIPNSVTSIGDDAFARCSGLTSVTIPNSVTSIGNAPFWGCSGLTEMKVDANNSKYDSREGCNAIIETASNTLIFGCQTTVIPNSVTSIGEWAFYNCSGLTSVTIPNSMTSIGDYAFQSCSGLTSVTIGNSVRSIGVGAFSWCSGLTSVTIGNSVESIGEEAFVYCSELHDVYCHAESVPSTDATAFDGSYIASVNLHVPDGSVASYKTTAPWSSFGTITALKEDLTLADGEEFENVEEKVYSTLTYTRTLPNLLWNPLYVPFKIPYEALEENYEVAYINAMHSYDNDENGEIDEMVMEIVKIKAGTLKPNHPYLIKAKNEEAMEMSIVQENATLYPADITTLDCSSVYTKFEITGTYQEMTSEDLNGSLVISTDGSWKKLSSTSTLKPFRFYLTISSREGSPVEISEEAMSSVRISVRGEFGNATGVDEVNAENGKQKSEIYDLSGRRVNAPAKGGVYIINGKKMIY